MFLKNMFVVRTEGPLKSNRSSYSVKSRGSEVYTQRQGECPSQRGPTCMRRKEGLRDPEEGPKPLADDNNCAKVRVPKRVKVHVF